MNLEGARVLVTGASRGIGRAMVMALRAEGAHPIACARGAEALAPLAELGCETLVQDVAAADAGERIAEAVGTLDVVVHNAGIQRYPDLAAEAPLLDLDREIEVNLLAPIRITNALLPRLRQSERAAIVNVTSILALAPKRSAPVYCASKAGLRSWTKALRAQLAPRVRVVELVPPLVQTNMTDGRDAGAVGPEVVARALVMGLRRDRDEIRVGKAKTFFALHRVAPGLAERMMMEK